ncbi:MAG: hypothetical protein HC821_02910 [Lewinella sp.]|nr:hypothetical protein [Lewinella sp.]
MFFSVGCYNTYGQLIFQENHSISAAGNLALPTPSQAGVYHLVLSWSNGGSQVQQVRLPLVVQP